MDRGVEVVMEEVKVFAQHLLLGCLETKAKNLIIYFFLEPESQQRNIEKEVGVVE